MGKIWRSNATINKVHVGAEIVEAVGTAGLTQLGICASFSGKALTATGCKIGKASAVAMVAGFGVQAVIDCHDAAVAIKRNRAARKELENGEE